MTRNATILSLVPTEETDEEFLREKFNVDKCTFITGSEIRGKGFREGLAYAKKKHAESSGQDGKGGVLIVNSRDWFRQANRTAIYTLACLIANGKRFAIDSSGRIFPLTWPGLILSEIPSAISQKIGGIFLLNRADKYVSAVLANEPERRTIARGAIKHIAYFRTDLWYGVKAGGSVGHVAGVVNGFIEHGIGTSVISWEKPQLISDSARFFGVPSETFHRNERELALLAYNDQLIKSAIRDLADRAPDAIYARYSLDCYAPAWLAGYFDVPLIIEYNGSEIWIEKNWGRGLAHPEIAEKIENLVLKCADLITVVSKPLADELVKRGFEEKRILVNPNSVDPSRFDSSRYSKDEIENLKRELGIPSGAIVAGFIGTFSPWHGIEVLANTIPMTLKNCPKLHYLLIGSGPLFENVKERIRIAGKLDQVTFTGLVPQNEAPKYLLCSDFFLSPHVPNEDRTPFFGSPTKLFEYMALGKGIIASDLDQIGEMLIDGKTALLVEPGNAESLAKAIQKLYENPELSKGLGGAAREDALRNHTWKAHVGKILDSVYSL